MQTKANWPTVAQKFRQSINTLDKFERFMARAKNEQEKLAWAFLVNAARTNPVVEYTVPRELREEFEKATFADDLTIGDLAFLPFDPMAISFEEDRSKMFIFGFFDGVLAIGNFTTVAAIGLDTKIGDFMRRQASESVHKTSLFILSAMCYLSGSDHRQLDQAKGSAKKYRNRKAIPVIRGEVGGIFMSSLRRWKEQEKLDTANRPHGSPRPHLRSGHFSRYWTGKGRTVPIIKFVHPCLVNADTVGPTVIQRRVSADPKE